MPVSQTKPRFRITFVRARAAAAARGLSPSKHYHEVSTGLFPRPVKIGPKMAVWPEFEIDEVNAARIAGKSDDEIRQLVRDLETARKNLVVGQGHASKDGGQ